MAGHLMPFAAFLMEPEPGAATLLEIVLHPQADDRADASEGVAHKPEQGAVTEADEFSSIDRFQQLAHLGARQHRRLTRPYKNIRVTRGKVRPGSSPDRIDIETRAHDEAE